jgi:hypothetical protein
MLVPIQKILPVVAKRLKMQHRTDLDKINSFWLSILKDVVGIRSSSKLKPLFLKNKALFISCPNPGWANELQIKQKELINKINKKLGHKKIERIGFVC